MNERVKHPFQCRCLEGYHFQKKIKDREIKRKNKEIKRNERAKTWGIWGLFLNWCTQSSSPEDVLPPSKFNFKPHESIQSCQNRTTSSLLLESRTKLRTGKLPPVKKPSNGVLGNLPAEILYMIVDELDDVSAVCLKITSSYFYTSINTDDMKFSLCKKWLIMCRLEIDVPDRPNLLACAFCKAKVWKGCFTPENGYHYDYGLDNLNLLSRNPAERYCLLHISNTLRDRRNSQKDYERNRWVKTQQMTCLHCGADIEPSDSRSEGCNGCMCEICPRALQPRYTRYGSLSTPTLEVFSFYKCRADPRMKSTIRDIDGRVSPHSNL